LFPYQQLLNDPDLAGDDLGPFIAQAPAEFFDEFSYGAELVSQDGAIAALTELGRVVELLTQVTAGPWEQVSQWISDRLSEAWQVRGPSLGMGAMMAAAGVQRGPVLARRVLDTLPPDTIDPWPHVEQAIAEDLDGLVGRSSRKAWEKLTADADRYR